MPLIGWLFGTTLGRFVAGLAIVALALGIVYGAGALRGRDQATLTELKQQQERTHEAIQGAEKVDRDVGNDSDRELIERMRRDDQRR